VPEYQIHTVIAAHIGDDEEKYSLSPNHMLHVLLEFII